MKKKERILLGVTVLLLLVLVGTVYKILGELGNAFIITIVILAIIISLAEELIFQGQGLFLKIARKIGLKFSKPKKTKR